MSCRLPGRHAAHIGHTGASAGDDTILRSRCGLGVSRGHEGSGGRYHQPGLCPAQDSLQPHGRQLVGVHVAQGASHPGIASLGPVHEGGGEGREGRVGGMSMPCTRRVRWLARPAKLSWGKRGQHDAPPRDPFVSEAPAGRWGRIHATIQCLYPWVKVLRVGALCTQRGLRGCGLHVFTDSAAILEAGFHSNVVNGP
jgi:hypothetical protein